ncbi:hypothetical protein BIW11_13268 [Tropilaelaps mercedesae]|uniref:Uncharacterized protein n=1 Tax=Tropilaelaps mercedesae TaxID=418985 RepID=A0A1V9X2X9_9ACAR|nr:hypothetical protein BIW11_13268 [Tropilaelaps mercedesae]
MTWLSSKFYRAYTVGLFSKQLRAIKAGCSAGRTFYQELARSNKRRRAISACWCLYVEQHSLRRVKRCSLTFGDQCRDSLIMKETHRAEMDDDCRGKVAARAAHLYARRGHGTCSRQKYTTLTDNVTAAFRLRRSYQASVRCVSIASTVQPAITLQCLQQQQQKRQQRRLVGSQSVVGNWLLQAALSGTVVRSDGVTTCSFRVSCRRRNQSDLSGQFASG